METQTEFCSSQQIETECNDLQVASEVQTQIIDNGVVKEVLNFKGIYNNSLGKTVAFVSPDFKLLQHKDYRKTTKEELGELAKVTPGAGTWNNYFAKLRRNGLIKYENGKIFLSEELTEG